MGIIEDKDKRMNRLDIYQSERNSGLQLSVRPRGKKRSGINRTPKNKSAPAPKRRKDDSEEIDNDGDDENEEGINEDEESLDPGNQSSEDGNQELSDAPEFSSSKRIRLSAIKKRHIVHASDDDDESDLREEKSEGEEEKEEEEKGEKEKEPSEGEEEEEEEEEEKEVEKEKEPSEGEEDNNTSGIHRTRSKSNNKNSKSNSENKTPKIEIPMNNKTRFWPTNIKEVVDKKELDRETTGYETNRDFWDAQELVYFNEKTGTYRVGTATSLSWDKGSIKFKDVKGLILMLKHSNIPLLDRIQITNAVKRYLSELEVARQLIKITNREVETTEKLEQIGGKYEINTFYNHGFNIFVGLLEKWTDSQKPKISHRGWEYYMDRGEPSNEEKSNSEEAYESVDDLIENIFPKVEGRSSEPMDKNEFNKAYQTVIARYADMTKGQLRISRKPARIFVINFLLKSCISAFMIIS